MLKRKLQNKSAKPDASKQQKGRVPSSKNKIVQAAKRAKQAKKK